MQLLHVIYRVEVDDAVTDSFRKLGAVRDGDKPYPALVEHLEQQIPDLRLRDDIEHRAYLISDDKLSLGREGAGYAKALHLAAG